MTARTVAGRNLAAVVSMACVLILLIAAVLWWVFQADTDTKITAYFGKAVGVYPGSAVRVLGIQVGRIDEVRPQGDRVRVDMSVERGVPVPADVRAVVIAPSLVSDRYVQLTPAYEDGPVLASGAVLPRERTATPVELDDLFKSVNDLSSALGPNGANRDGAVSDLLNTAAANLGGNGQTLNDTIKQLGDAAATLTNSKGDLFATVDNLQKFTAALAASDGQLRQFDAKLADVTGFLADNRDKLGAALASLGTALLEVQGFINDNKELVASNVDKLTSVSKVLVDQRAAIAELLDIAPTAATNFINAYDAASGTIAVRGNINELTYPPIMMVCQLLERSTPAQVPRTLSDVCKQLAPLLDGTLTLPSPQQGTLPPLPLVGATNQGGGR